MYVIKQSCHHVILQNVLSSLAFVVVFPIIMSLFESFEFVAVLPIVFLTIYYFIMLIYNSLRFKNTIYFLKKSSIVISKGVFLKYQICIPYKAVNFIEKKQNILQRISQTETINLYTTSGKNRIKNIFPSATKMIEIKLCKENRYEI